MADLKKLKEAILEDGIVDSDEVAKLEKVLYEDGIIDREEIDLLVALRNEAKDTCPEFSTLFFKAMKDHVLADKVIDQDEVRLLADAIFADNVVDDDEKQLLRDLKAGARQVCPEFDELCSKCLK